MGGLACRVGCCVKQSTKQDQELPDAEASLGVIYCNCKLGATSRGTATCTWVLTLVISIALSYTVNVSAKDQSIARAILQGFNVISDSPNLEAPYHFL